MVEFVTFCSKKNELLTLSVGQWRCVHCKAQLERDISAAINLKNDAVSSAASVCGEGGTGYGSYAKVKPASVKQEVSTKAPYG